MSELLILTVGTGTAGKYSDVAQGLANTIRAVQPRKFWLIPSASEKSVPVAELIQEALQDLGAFAPWSESAIFLTINNHDDVLECRRTVRTAIIRAKEELRSGEKLIVNPTSGTKQMSAGATLAALDEEVGRIDFTSGQRVDGVVKTGTEIIQSFDVRRFLFQRDLRTADEFFRQGAFFSAARLLSSMRYPDPEFPEALHPRETALCHYEWQRLNYPKAVSHAARLPHWELRKHLEMLCAADEFSFCRLGDLLAGAQDLLSWGELEEALARFYRSAEQTAKVRLASDQGIRPPYRLEAFLSFLPPHCKVSGELRNRMRDGELQIGNDLAWRILKELRDPMAEAYFADTRLMGALGRRNRSLYGHGHESVGKADVESVANRLRNLLGGHMEEVIEFWKRPGVESLNVGASAPK